MNVQLTQVLSDVTGVSGMAIIEAILAGERDPVKLANRVDRRVRATPDKIQKALEGDYRQEHLFVLQQAFCCMPSMRKGQRLRRANRARNRHASRQGGPQRKPLRLAKRPPAGKDKMQGQDMREVLYRKYGSDLTAIEGIGVTTALVVLTEVGPNVTGSKPKSILLVAGLCRIPHQRGKVLSSHTRGSSNRASDALRMAAVTLERSQSLWRIYRRMKGRLGAAEAITATAHKLAGSFTV